MYMLWKAKQLTKCGKKYKMKWPTHLVWLNCHTCHIWEFYQRRFFLERQREEFTTSRRLNYWSITWVKNNLSSSPSCTLCGNRSWHSGMCKTFHELQLDPRPQGRPPAPECQCSEYTHTQLGMNTCTQHVRCGASWWFTNLWVAASQETFVLQELHEVVTHCRLIT